MLITVDQRALGQATEGRFADTEIPPSEHTSALAGSITNDDPAA